MIFWAIGISFLAGLVTLAVIFANGMRSSPGPFVGRTLIELAWVITLVVWLFWLFSPAHARDLDGRYANSKLKPWFDQLKSGKGLCCSDADGTALSDVDWQSKGGNYRVWLDGEWHDVPEDAVITEPNRAGRTMVWPQRGYSGLRIVCFMPGPMT